MSQDLFDFEEWGADCPVEFSSISCSGTSSSPSQSSVPAPVPQAPPVLPTPPSPSGFVCSVCQKFYKTARYFNKHLEIHPEGATTTPAPGTASISSSSQTLVFQCSFCKSILKTEGGFLKHLAAHKLKDALKQMPTIDEFKEENLPSLIREIVQEILKEPSYGDNQKALFLIDCSEHEGWSDFISMLSDPILAIVFDKQTKFLPMNQYEEMQKRVNTFLNINIETLRESLLKCGSTLETSCALAGRLVFRIAFKLFQGTHTWIMKEMRATQSDDISIIQLGDISEEEEKSFLSEVGGFIRTFFQRGLKNPMGQWSQQSNCIKAVFVDGQLPISTARFLNKSNWYSGEEECIILSHHCSSFFKILEFEIMVATNDTTSHQEAIENLLLHGGLLEHWYYLTSAYFDEESSLLFLKGLVTSYVKFSLKFEERRLNRLEEKSVRASIASLRTHLQTNYVEKGGKK